MTETQKLRSGLCYPFGRASSADGWPSIAPGCSDELVMGPALIDNYKKVTGIDIGNFSYAANGKLYLEDKNGNVKGQYVADILQGIIPKDEYDNFPELLSSPSVFTYVSYDTSIQPKNVRINVS